MAFGRVPYPGQLKEFNPMDFVHGRGKWEEPARAARPLRDRAARAGKKQQGAALYPLGL